MPFSRNGVLSGSILRIAKRKQRVLCDLSEQEYQRHDSGRAISNHSLTEFFSAPIMRSIVVWQNVRGHGTDNWDMRGSGVGDHVGAVVNGGDVVSH